MSEPRSRRQVRTTAARPKLPLQEASVADVDDVSPEDATPRDPHGVIALGLLGAVAVLLALLALAISMSL